MGKNFEHPLSLVVLTTDLVHCSQSPIHFRMDIFTRIQSLPASIQEKISGFMPDSRMVSETSPSGDNIHRVMSICGAHRSVTEEPNGCHVSHEFPVTQMYKALVDYGDHPYAVVTIRCDRGEARIGVRPTVTLFEGDCITILIHPDGTVIRANRAGSQEPVTSHLIPNRTGRRQTWVMMRSGSKVSFLNAEDAKRAHSSMSCD